LEVLTGQTTSKPICRSCGAEIPSDAPQGYCLKCLFALGTAKPEDGQQKSEARGQNEADAASPSPGGEGWGEGGQTPPRSADFPRRSFGDYEMPGERAGSPREIGQVQLTLTGKQVSRYAIETSSLLTHWTSANLTVTVTNQNGAVVVPAPGATNDAQRYYQAVWQ